MAPGFMGVPRHSYHGDPWRSSNGATVVLHKNSVTAPINMFAHTDKLHQVLLGLKNRRYALFVPKRNIPPSERTQHYTQRITSYWSSVSYQRCSSSIGERSAVHMPGECISALRTQDTNRGENTKGTPTRRASHGAIPWPQHICSSSHHYLVTLGGIQKHISCRRPTCSNRKYFPC